MSDQVLIQCGPADRAGRRVVIATLGNHSHRDRFDADSEFQRRKFREAVISKFGLPDAAHEAIESQIIAAADREDENGGSIWQPSVVNLQQVEPRQTDWLWDQYIPRGAITVVDGDPGLGKSQLTIDLAARLSRGDCMPPQHAANGTYTPRGTLILNVEDDPARTLRPRLDAAGAVPSRIHLLNGMDGFDGEEKRPVVLPLDLGVIESIIKQHAVGMVILDPFVAYLDSKLSMNSDADVRRCLGQVATMAERTGVAVLLVRHLNKKSGQSAIYRGGGSIGITGAARAAFLVGTDPDDRDCRIFAPVKCNLAPEPSSLSFEIESVDTTSRIRWGDVTGLTAADLLQTDKQQGGSKCDQAKEIIADILADGPRGENEVKTACVEAGFSKATYWRARKSLNVQSEKTDFRGEWLLSLPGRNGVASHDF